MSRIGRRILYHRATQETLLGCMVILRQRLIQALTLTASSTTVSWIFAKVPMTGAMTPVMISAAYC